MSTKFYCRRYTGIVLIGGALIASGCSSTKVPTETLAKAELAVSQASESKAPQEATSELFLARTKLDQARRAMEAERYKDARRLAEQALVDAQLAEAKAEAVDERETLQQMRTDIEALRTEANRAIQQTQ